MAEKKGSSRAEKAVSNVKKKVDAPASSKSAGKKTAAGKGSKKKSTVKTEYDSLGIPANTLIAIVSLLLFILFLIISIKPDGALLRIVLSFVLGLLGQAGFYFSIPAFLYLFLIHTFGRKTRVTLRSVCTILFVIVCGSIFHLVVHNYGLAEGVAAIKELYWGGMQGLTGGVICGGLAELVRWSCGNVLSYVILVMAAMFTLLGAMEITVPSLIRAIANRPREEVEEEDDYVEPAAVVVNHIANKQIAHKRQMRERAAAAAEVAALPTADKKTTPKPQKQTPVMPQAEEEPVTTGTPSKAAGVMSTIDLDISAPVYGASSRPPEKTASAKTPEKMQESSASRMPALELDTDPPDFVTQKQPVPQKQAAPQRTSAPVQKPAPKPQPKQEPEQTKPGKVTSKEAAESAKEVASEIEQNQMQEKSVYCFPPIDLLKRPVRGGPDGMEEMRENSRRLNETLASFRIDAHIINVTRGPSVTRYEVELDKGVRLSKLTGCADDIALSLGASGVRIAAVPGKISVVGIEVPNRAVTNVSLREVIDSPEFSRAKSKSSFAVGKDIGGNCIVGNIAKMPHMLIAGTTGSGKSVCMNSIIISLLYKAGPEDVKLIMVDPKMVELGIYNSIPHLLIPVVTDPKKAAGSLQWAVTEMLRRYKMMSDLGVRDLESYNSIVTAEEGGQKLPQVVIIIDELADLMLVAAKEVEDSICRIAQMGRAAGMHLIIATQRPSADVITGLMKANIPSRIAFSVASSMESRIILDTMGAEKLVGKGDMLYSPIGSGKPLRVQGCFVTDSEVEAVAGYVKDHYVADYNQQVLEEIEKKAQQTGKKAAPGAEPEASDEELEGDEMLPAAVDVILETGQASVSMLQRRLKLGYARAARIVDEMEEKGIVGPFQGSKPRSILITKEKWEMMRGGQAQQMAFDDLSESEEAIGSEV